MTTRTIKVGALARVEGEGALKVTIRDGEVKHAELNIFEPPRFFEGFMRGRAFTEAPDIHRTHLRHLPGRLSDECGACDGSGDRCHDLA